MPPRITDLRAHLLSNIAFAESGCWIWLKKSESNGYGRFCANRRNILAHRAAYEIFTGPIPDGYQVDHLCRVRRCVNPAHLEAVTQTENIHRSDAPTIVNWRADVCKYGHPMADAYPQRRKGRVVGRICRTCTKAKNAERYRKRRKYIDAPVVRPEVRA